MATNSSKIKMDVMGSLETTRSSLALMDCMRILKGTRSSALDVARALSFDPNLAESLIKEVNSPYFALPNKVEKLEHAIALLGFNRVGELLHRSVPPEMYQHAQTSYFEMVGFQKHGVAVACLAEQVARALRYDEPKQFFDAGMLHDIGKYLYLTKLSQEFQKLSKEIRETGVPMYQVERKLFATDHTELGEMMADAWGLPDEVRVGIRYHHGITDEALEKLTSRETLMVQVITFANLLSHGTHYGGLAWGAKLPYDPVPTPPGHLLDADVRQLVRLAEQQYKDLCKNMALE